MKALTIETVSGVLTDKNFVVDSQYQNHNQVHFDKGTIAGYVELHYDELPSIYCWIPDTRILNLLTLADLGGALDEIEVLEQMRLASLMIAMHSTPEIQDKLSKKIKEKLSH